MSSTSVRLDSTVRERLKRYAGSGESMSETIGRLLDRIESDRFFGHAVAAIHDPDHPWETIDLDADPAWD